MNPPAMGYCDSEEEDSKDSSSWRGWQVFPDKVAALQWFEYGHDAERMGDEASTRVAGGVDNNNVDFIRNLKRRRSDGLLKSGSRRIRRSRLCRPAVSSSTRIRRFLEHANTSFRRSGDVARLGTVSVRVPPGFSQRPAFPNHRYEPDRIRASRNRIDGFQRTVLVQ
jgi:hypothetical protein